MAAEFKAACRGLMGGWLSPRGPWVTCCLSGFMLFSSPSSEWHEGEGRRRGDCESCTIETARAAKKLVLISCSLPHSVFKASGINLRVQSREICCVPSAENALYTAMQKDVSRTTELSRNKLFSPLNVECGHHFRNSQGYSLQYSSVKELQTL